MKKLKYIAIFFLVAVALGLSQSINRQEFNKDEEDNNIAISGKLLEEYTKSYSQEIIKSATKDLNMDGKDDGIVIYRENKSKNFMVVIVTDKDSFYITEPIKAPLENQKIKFKDIDNKDEMEVIVSGEKNGAIGYGIYRIENGKFKDIFAEGMELCC
ncbi:MAG: Cys-Cys-COOH (seleno)protein SaoC [Filifactoraceae bacterium]